MKEAPHVEFSPWLKRLGFVVFGVLCVPGLIAVAVLHAANVDKVQAFTPYLAVIGVSGAIGLFVHALTHLALTPVALYLHFRRVEGLTPIRALGALTRGVAQTIVAGGVMLVVAMLVAGVLQALLGKEISNWVVLAIAVAGAVAYDLQRRRINTIDLSKSRDISLK